KILVPRGFSVWILMVIGLSLLKAVPGFGAKTLIPDRGGVLVKASTEVQKKMAASKSK
ncbi:28349_t:CDS:1, partial [Dentiscutata erythropus]